MKYILVVDDDPMITSVFKRYFEQHDYSVSIANSGEAALEVCQKVVIDALITDYRMTGMNGSELVQHVRKSQPYLPIIFISAYGKEIKVVPDGRTIIMNKPTQFQDVLEALRGLIEDENRAKELNPAWIAAARISNHV